MEKGKPSQKNVQNVDKKQPFFSAGVHDSRGCLCVYSDDDIFECPNGKCAWWSESKQKGGQTSTSTGASFIAEQRASVASEQRKLFGYSQKSSSRKVATNKKPGKLQTCTLKFVCLASRTATSPPSSIRDRTYLSNCGLGDGSVTFSPSDVVYEGLLNHYLPLKEAGGFELFLFQRGGGEHGGFHKIQPPHTASHLKELAGQAKVYIRPLQKDLEKITDLVAQLQAPDHIPLVECFTCGQEVPMNDMTAHQIEAHEDAVSPVKKQKTIDEHIFDSDKTEKINIDDDKWGDEESDNEIGTSNIKSQNLEELSRIFPDHSRDHLKALTGGNNTLQDAINTVLDGDSKNCSSKKGSNLQLPPTTVHFTSLPDALENLRQKNMNGPISKVTIDPDDIITDTIAYYKTKEFDGSRKLRVLYTNQPGVDTGGISRQFFTDAIEAIVSSPIYKLFEGPNNRKLPAYNITSVHSGLFEVLGRLIGHGILQTSIGYPYLAARVYWYIATGDIHKALSYASIDDVVDENLRPYIERVTSADRQTMEELGQDG